MEAADGAERAGGRAGGGPEAVEREPLRRPNGRCPPRAAAGSGAEGVVVRRAAGKCETLSTVTHF